MQTPLPFVSGLRLRQQSKVTPACFAEEKEIGVSIIRKVETHNDS